MNDETPAPEFSYILGLRDISPAGKRVSLSADAGQRAALAKRFDVIEIETLIGALTVKPTKQRINVVGQLQARLRRQCVVSLEEMTEEIDESFELGFVRDADLLEDDDESGEGPELHEGDAVDVGEILAQQLSLSMAPFPRKEGASLDDADTTALETSPFAAIAGKLGKMKQNH